MILPDGREPCCRDSGSVISYRDLQVRFGTGLLDADGAGVFAWLKGILDSILHQWLQKEPGDAGIVQGSGTFLLIVQTGSKADLLYGDIVGNQLQFL